jgi:antitoxin component of RelBE/YafQ-DinJ toxin-antitoxin module
MVTGRMPMGKKEAGNAVLESLGTNASAAINRLYDFLIENGSLPFSDKPALAEAEIVARIALVDGIALPAGNRFSLMDDDDIRRERLGGIRGKAQA